MKKVNKTCKLIIILLLILANFNSKLPLAYYNHLAEGLAAKEEAPDYSGASSGFFASEIINPNSHNRANAFPIRIRSAMPKDDQVGI